MKTVRFSQVAAKCGPPEPYTLWSAPETDKKFQSALKGHRVMSIHQETSGSKKDYGEVGWDKQGNLLLFRKSLKAFEGRRVVGVKYELLASPPPASPVPVLVKPKKKRQAKRAAPSFPKPEPVKVPAEKPSDKNAARDLEKLKSSVRHAMKELQDGKAVAAYQTLEGALDG